ncbi:MAG: Uma2 family endonuclease, partial [Frankiales bacterium]|nr:Uma2 family endonuclease [Frankiales bacterium]
LQEAGVPSYWLVDPDDGVDTVLELQDAVYVEVARGANVTVQQPFPVTVSLG